ncbi:MAG: HD-GYP domain-containing protein, partial [Lachnospiraceae bacterium]|nr:HD-GYP domain-containing protein [Lachnospiraceae bacterium]
VMILVTIGLLLVGLAVLYFPVWASILTTIVLLGGVLLVNMFLFQLDIYYLPVTMFLIVVGFGFAFMFSAQWTIGRIGVRNLPIDAVIRFTDTIVKIEHSVSYAEYLMKNRNEIEEDISASLLLPVMDGDSFLLKELSEENYRNRKFVESEFGNRTKNSGSSVIQTRSNLFQGEKYIAFVPLPVFDVESEATTYTVIGVKKKLKPQNASYISMMLFSMYIYFKAQHERGEHQRMYFSMLSLMISVIDAKDPVTAGHSQRVANISKDIGIWMQLSKKDQIDLEFTALLHDIGKIGVSDYVLNKPSVYTQNDFEQMKYHTIRGAEMLSEVGISEEIIDGVRHHHERMDGKGYPDGLKGNELHLFAKIIKIADVFDALTSKRQYKEEWEIEKALNIIHKGRGTEFDTEIADVFIEHMSPPGWIPPIDGSRRLRKAEDPNAENAIQIFNDFFEKYGSYLTVEYPISSKKAKKVDFAYKSGFMQYDWGETFNNPAFLEAKPMILAYENETKSLLFGQGSHDSGVHSIYYYFFKGFVNMGVFLLEQSKVKETLAMLADIYGEPQVMDAQTEIFPAEKMRIVFYRTDDERCLLFYISDYMCNNYVFK